MIVKCYYNFNIKLSGFKHYSTYFHMKENYLIIGYFFFEFPRDYSWLSLCCWMVYFPLKKKKDKKYFAILFQFAKYKF